MAFVPVKGYLTIFNQKVMHYNAQAPSLELFLFLKI